MTQPDIRLNHNVMLRRSLTDARILLDRYEALAPDAGIAERTSLLRRLRSELRITLGEAGIVMSEALTKAGACRHDVLPTTPGKRAHVETCPK